MGELYDIRQISARPSSSAPIQKSVITVRPITQQGLTGQKTKQSSSNAGRNRIYRDKRYYLTDIQKQAAATKDEKILLTKETKDLQLASFNLPELEKIATKMAQTLCKKQIDLNTLNMVLALNISKTKTSDILEQFYHIAREEVLMKKALAQGLRQNKQLEDETASLEEDILLRENQLRQKIKDMSFEEKNDYFQIVGKNKEYSENIKDIKLKIKEKEFYVKELRFIIDKSVMQLQFFDILLKLKKIKEEKVELQLYLDHIKNPELERQNLLEKLKKEKMDIEALNKMKTRLDKQIKDTERKSMEVCPNLDGKDSTKLQTNKDLRDRSEYIENFIINFGEKVIEVRVKIADQQYQIDMALECISEVEAEINLKDLQITFDDDNKNEKYWTNMCLILKKNMNRGASILTTYQREIKWVYEKRDEIFKQQNKYTNPKKALKELIATKTKLLANQNRLQATFDSTQSAIAETKTAKEKKIRNIEDNEKFQHLIHLDVELKNVKVKKEELLNQITKKSRNEQYDSILVNIRDILNLQNEYLILCLQTKNSKSIFSLKSTHII